MPYVKMKACTKKMGVINLFHCKRSEIQYCSCLTEMSIDFVIDATMFESKTGSLPQLCPLYDVFFYDFHFKTILKERGRSIVQS